MFTDVQISQIELENKSSNKKSWGNHKRSETMMRQHDNRILMLMKF